MACKCLDLLKFPKLKFSYILDRKLLRVFSEISPDLQDIDTRVFIHQNAKLLKNDIDKARLWIHEYKEYIISKLCPCIETLIKNHIYIVIADLQDKEFSINGFDSSGLETAGAATICNIILLDSNLFKNPKKSKDYFYSVFNHEITHLLDSCSYCPVENDKNLNENLSDSDIFLRIRNMLDSNPQFIKLFIQNFTDNTLKALAVLGIRKFFEPILDQPEVKALYLKRLTARLNAMIRNEAEIYAYMNQFICFGFDGSDIFRPFTTTIFLDSLQEYYSSIETDPEKIDILVDKAMQKLDQVFLITYVNWLESVLDPKILDEICLPHLKNKKFAIIENCDEKIKPEVLDLELEIIPVKESIKKIDGEDCITKYIIAINANTLNNNFYCCNKVPKPINIFYFYLYLIDTKCLKNNTNKCYLLFSKKRFKESIKNRNNNLRFLLNLLYYGCSCFNSGSDLDNGGSVIETMPDEVLDDFYEQMLAFCVNILKDTNINLINDEFKIIE